MEPSATGSNQMTDFSSPWPPVKFLLEHLYAFHNLRALALHPSAYVILYELKYETSLPLFYPAFLGRYTVCCFMTILYLITWPNGFMFCPMHGCQL